MQALRKLFQSLALPLMSEFDLSAIHVLGYGAFCIKSNMMTDPRECPITATWQSH